MHRSGFSLASLLLLTAVVAVFLAAIGTIWLPSGDGAAGRYDRAELNVDEGLIALCAAGGLTVGPVVGLFIGAGRVRRVRGAVLGMLVGAFAGVGSGLLLVAPGKALPIAGGSLVVVLFGAIVRRFSDTPRP